MSTKNDLTISLHPRQIDYLEQIVQKHDLPDSSKAIRCLINYAMDKPDEETAIFDEIRCREC